MAAARGRQQAAAAKEGDNKQGAWFDEEPADEPEGDDGGRVLEAVQVARPEVARGGAWRRMR